MTDPRLWIAGLVALPTLVIALSFLWLDVEAIVRIDTLSSTLLPLSAGLWLLTVAVTPRAALDRRGLRRTALATLITLGSFLTESAVVLLLLSVASVWTFQFALADPAPRSYLPSGSHC